MKKSKNNNIILGFGYWVFEFGFSWCKGKVISFQYSKSQGFIEKHHSQNYSSRTLNPYMSFIRNMIMGHLGTSDCLRHTSLPETLAPWKNSPPTHFKICPMRQFFLNFGCELQWWVVQLSQDPKSLQIYYQDPYTGISYERGESHQFLS